MVDGLLVCKKRISRLKKIKLCTHYEYNGKKLEDFPASLKILEKCKPVYEEMDGWDDLSDEEWRELAEKGYDALPKELKDYLKTIEEIGGVPVYLISVGPGRESTICLREIF